ncbi:MAG: hypothetical protein V4667_10695 [Bacteroidota bacterium]
MEQSIKDKLKTELDIIERYYLVEHPQTKLSENEKIAFAYLLNLIGKLVCWSAEEETNLIPDIKSNITILLSKPETLDYVILTAYDDFHTDGGRLIQQAKRFETKLRAWIKESKTT